MTTDRPAAPLIPATPALLQDWCGPVIIEGAPCWSPWNGIDDEVVWRDDREDWQEAVNFEGDRPGSTLVAVTVAGEVRGILLDLRRPEVQDRVRRVWWGEGEALAWALWECWRAMEERVASPYPQDRAGGARHVPALASLPDTDTLAWALWECWRAMEDR